jgi:hypothetical protein
VPLNNPAAAQVNAEENSFFPRNFSFSHRVLGAFGLHHPGDGAGFLVTNPIGYGVVFK